MLTPERFDQAVAGDDFVGVEEKGRQQQALLCALAGKWTAVLPDLERPEDPEVHVGQAQLDPTPAVRALPAAYRAIAARVDRPPKRSTQQLERSLTCPRSSQLSQS